MSEESLEESLLHLGLEMIPGAGSGECLAGAREGDGEREATRQA